MFLLMIPSYVASQPRSGFRQRHPKNADVHVQSLSPSEEIHLKRHGEGTNTSSLQHHPYRYSTPSNATVASPPQHARNHASTPTSPHAAASTPYHPTSHPATNTTHTVSRQVTDHVPIDRRACTIPSGPLQNARLHVKKDCHHRNLHGSSVCISEHIVAVHGRRDRIRRR